MLIADAKMRTYIVFLTTFFFVHLWTMSRSTAVCNGESKPISIHVQFAQTGLHVLPPSHRSVVARAEPPERAAGRPERVAHAADFGDALPLGWHRRHAEAEEAEVGEGEAVIYGVEASE